MADKNRAISGGKSQDSLGIEHMAQKYQNRFGGNVEIYYGERALLESLYDIISITNCYWQHLVLLFLAPDTFSSILYWLSVV